MRQTIKNTGFSLHFVDHFMILCFANLQVKVTKYQMVADIFALSTPKLSNTKLILLTLSVRRPKWCTLEYVGRRNDATDYATA